MRMDETTRMTCEPGYDGEEAVTLRSWRGVNVAVTGVNKEVE